MDGLKTLAVAVDARGIATVALRRGDVLNAFDETMIAELTDAYTTLGARDDVRAIVLRADGRAFCAGADLQWMQRASANDAAANLRDAERFAAMMRAIRHCAKPTVARVQGHAFGGGVGLCAACDIVIASDQARFSVSEARFGILPAVIGPYLVEAVGQRQARRLALTATQLGASEAVAIGLIHQAVPLDALDAALERTLAELSRNGPNALMEIKRFFDAIGEYPPSAERAAFTAQTISRARATAEAKEGFAAFFAKRPPAWEPGVE
ncbi:enoyl-CoA hydratase/isomerase family protein [Burkholderia vietnamiensis]|uniref:enoyl-CoA hydratase-related protein n=1 Tax=Burkholderia vietnamiensis TaxID=60552 RepID=UPI00075D3AA7|nr:enoyl-CoA hydratase-related protein [Burkholderia vietnamiensis]KVF06744.1 enoyl-CoA hydratase [Burkholderia vietnamiensis]KVF34241.1 enoyl-CoA hydratase [Burkholderia vietnamiensis]MDN7411697.1 enoyl-CoA hydratase-related protein [Burkholderia vietnamiensis]MDN8110795.1 enoyl-CoA hydratase-related protein [Burkholderia vietnamiensis]HDR8995007.1 enoyl-CoA hydratase/isomerase family protein [Burkholderia vietnamiensis]